MTRMTQPPAARRKRRPRRIRFALGLLLLAPLGAEYLIGYLPSTGNPVEIALELLIFAPLYGAPALLIRETAARLGLTWPGILALAAALGVVQAGVIDQSLFSESYQGYAGWAEDRLPTLIEPLGVSASDALGFIAGHVIWSFAVPIALVEALAGGSRAPRTPWLRTPGLIVTTLLYAAAAWLIRQEHLRTEPDHASPGQVIGTLVVVALLIAVAVTAGRRRRPRLERAVPGPIATGLVIFAGAAAFDLVPNTWPGVAAAAAILTAGAAAVAACSRSTRWSARHRVAVATGALLAHAIAAFLVVPFGDVPEIAKYAHNLAFLAGSAALAGWAWRRSGPGEEVRRPSAARSS